MTIEQQKDAAYKLAETLNQEIAAEFLSLPLYEVNPYLRGMAAASKFYLEMVKGRSEPTA